MSISCKKYFFKSANSNIFSFFGNTEKSFFKIEFSDVYFQDSSFLVGNPLFSKFFIAEVRTSCKSEFTSICSSKAIKDDSNFSFNSILFIV